MGRPRKRDLHLPACVYRRGNSLYYVRHGRWMRLGPASDLRACLVEYARLVTTASAGGGMAQLIEETLPRLTAGRAAATQKLYTLAARKLQTMLVEFRPDQVRPADVAAVRRALADTPVMANRCLSVLRMVFDQAVEDELVEANPCVGVRRNPVARRTRRLAHREFAAVRAVASERLRIVMDLCALTGQRIGDVLALRRSDLLPEGVHFRQQKTGAELIVRWTPALRAATEAAKAAHGRIVSVYVVRGRGHRPLAYQPIYRDWRAACAAAGVADANIHDLRALAATEAKRQGKDAQALLGHTSERMTAGYLRDRDVPVVDGPELPKAAEY